MDPSELAGLSPPGTELTQVLAIPAELDDAAVLVPVGDVEVAVGQKREIGRAGKMSLVVSGHPVLAKGHDEFTVHRELPHLFGAHARLAAPVHHPDVVRGRTDSS